MADRAHTIERLGRWLNGIVVIAGVLVLLWGNWFYASLHLEGELVWELRVNGMNLLDGSAGHDIATVKDGAVRYAATRIKFLGLLAIGFVLLLLQWWPKRVLVSAVACSMAAVGSYWLCESLVGWETTLGNMFTEWIKMSNLRYDETSWGSVLRVSYVVVICLAIVNWVLVVLMSRKGAHGEQVLDLPAGH